MVGMCLQAIIIIIIMIMIIIIIIIIMSINSPLYGKVKGKQMKFFSLL